MGKSVGFGVVNLILNSIFSPTFNFGVTERAVFIGEEYAKSSCNSHYFGSRNR